MALAPAIQGARKRGQTITWSNDDGQAEDLTGLTLSGRIKKTDGVATIRAIDGTLTVTDGPAGEFTWAYGSTDVSEADTFEVQFVAVDGSELKLKTFAAEWTVHPGFDEA